VIDHLTDLAMLVVLLPLAGGLIIQLFADDHVGDHLNRVFALTTAGAGLSLGGMDLWLRPAATTGLLTIDPVAVVFLCVTSLVGMASALLSPRFLDGTTRSFFSPQRSRRWYYLGFYCFWAALLAVPLAGNLGLAWLLVEATTAASAPLVAFSGKRSALEAGWKYLILTTAGLTVALLGILVVYASAHDPGLGALGWTALSRLARHIPRDVVLVSFFMMMAGFAAKIGWAPVHNWLPDAHSESPPPVSALLSAALLPTVMLVAWRVKIALGPALGGNTASYLFIGFGLLSLAVAVPFLWRPMPLKRLLAYSSLEHMGIIALGIGFGTPLAIAGVVLHVAAHAGAKALGFYTATPLLASRPSAAKLPVRGLAMSSPALASSFALSLGTLGGVPPSPLFFSELFILLGGFLAGQVLAASLAALLLALGFLGLLHALLEGLLGGRRHRVGTRSRHAAGVLAGFGAATLSALVSLAFVLPGSFRVEAIVRWAS
jgi:hydrogenase-4 component F